MLKQVGYILREMSAFPDLVFRKGGEEFALLIPRKGIAYGIHVGEQTRIAVEKHSFELLDGTKIKITVSVGFQSMKASEQFIQAADDALYYSKRNGRNKVSSAS